VRRETTMLVILTLTLMLVGVLMVYSITAIRAPEERLLKTQLIYVALALAALFAAAHVDYHLFRLPLVLRGLVAVSLVLLVLVLIPGLGVKIDGAQRWLRIGGAQFQPSEVAKVAMVVWLAAWLAGRPNQVRSFWRGFLPSVAIGVLFAGLILLERDLGMPVVLMAVAFVMLFVAGARTRHLALGLCSGLLGVAALSIASPHRYRRLSAFIDPWGDRTETGWQLVQSLAAFVRGGIWGEGAGASQQKLYYLPAAHTDFVFAIWAEEMGLVGAFALIALYVMLLVVAVRVSRHARDLFGALLAIGVTTLISFQGVFIMAVTVGLLPTKGLPLPFVGYGGTALVVFAGLMGILVNIGRQAVHSDGRIEPWSLGVVPNRSSRPGEAVSESGAPMRIMITGGGTGGHTSPAIAILQELQKRDPRLTVQWVGRKGGLEERVSKAHGVPFRSLPVEGWPRTRTLRRVWVGTKLVLGVARAYLLLKTFRPQLVLGVGGYASLPLAWVAQRTGVPTVLHEQNKRLGLANRVLARRAARLLLSYPDTLGEYPRERALVVGNPVRAAFCDPPDRDTARARLGLGLETPVLLVVGGSQGAHQLNAAVTELLQELGAEDLGLLWMTGAADAADARAAAEACAAPVQVFAFIDDMAAACAAADLVVARAGASTTAELAVLGKPAILVPFPHATDNHQEGNARAFEEVGAAVVLLDADCSGPRLLAVARGLLADGDRLEAMRAASRGLARPGAAEVIAEEILSLAFEKAPQQPR